MSAKRRAPCESPLVVPRFGDALAAFVAEIRAHLPDTELHAIIGVTRGGDLYT
jgi:hypothetical protein